MNNRMKKIKFIYNPYSGENKIVDLLDHIILSYQERGYQVEPFRLVHNAPLAEAIMSTATGYEHILVSGGDGTINEVVNQLINNKINTPLAVLPGGTANDFAHAWTGWFDKSALQEILDGKKVSIDLGKVNDRYLLMCLVQVCLLRFHKNNF